MPVDVPDACSGAGSAVLFVRTKMRGRGSDRRSVPGTSAGDQTAHVLWRIANGETLEKHPPRVVVIIVGRSELRLLQKTKEDPMLAAPGTAYRYAVRRRAP
jgi:hypothetical protein